MTETNATLAPRTRSLPPRDARGRFVAGLGAAPMAPHAASPRTRTNHPRERSLPSRDARGRFVAFPTTSAPSWYVLCADGYRIPGEADVMPVPASPPPAPHAARTTLRIRFGVSRLTDEGIAEQDPSPWMPAWSMLPWFAEPAPRVAARAAV